MNITLDNFRTLANGEANLGFVQLTRENGALGIDKANNFKHRIWKNRADESASSDNLIVRQKLVQAFTDAGAGSGFLRDLRTRLGLDNPQTTAAILTRNELREIFTAFDSSQERATRAAGIFNSLAESYIPEPDQREAVKEQLRMLKDAFADACTAQQSKQELTNLMMQFGRTLQDLRRAFIDHPQPAPHAPDPLQVQNEQIQQKKQELEQLHQRFARLNTFQQMAHPIDEAAENDLAWMRKSVKELPNFTDQQRLTILDILGERIGQLRARLRTDVRDAMVDRNAIDLRTADDRLRKGWTAIDTAMRALVLELGLNGVDEAHGEGALFRNLILTKFEDELTKARKEANL